MQSEHLPLARARLGRTLRERWTLDELLGVGGMAAVYAASHRNGGRVAIKMLHPSLSASERLTSSFLREGWLLNRIRHPNVPRVLDDDVDPVDGSIYLILDLLPGISLSKRAAKRLLDEVEALEVADQMLDVLAAAHDVGIVHRDVKPENVLVDESGTVRLVDFGIARDALAPRNGRLTTLSGEGVSFGTPGYMAPEQIVAGSSVTPRTDLWAVGATLFAVTTGELPHVARGAQELISATLTRAPRPIASVRPDLSPMFAAIVDCALQRDPARRPSSARDMQRALRCVGSARGLALEPPPPPSRKISSRIRAVRIEPDLEAALPTLVANER